MPATPKNIKVTVAQGRTFIHDGKNYGPGSMLDLPNDDVVRFRELGFLVDPEASAASVEGGPPVSLDTAPTGSTPSGSSTSFS